MIYSMTGYAAQVVAVAGGQLALELRSVNSRFLDLHFRFADEVRALEPLAREQIAARVRRGKVECRVGLTATDSAATVLDAEALARLVALQGEVLRSLPEALPLSVSDVLRWPGVLADARLDVNALSEHFATLMDATLVEFNACRAREGDKLAQVVMAAAEKMRAILADVAPRIPAAQTALADKLLQRLKDALQASGATVDANRVVQEVTLFAARIDVAEELARLSTHLDELERIFKTGGAVGKRLDFLMQELNREANTLASKAAVTEVTNAAMELKLLIEQMREQVQNLE